MESRRQLAAIMFTDITGYTALMQKDESLAMDLRNRHRDSFSRLHQEYDGEIVQYFGDGTLSIFKSSVHAVQCAIALQQEMQREPKVPLRIGIHTGDIIHTKEEIIGDGVNLASRIEALAKPGSILISDQLHFQIKNHGIETQSQGWFELKNVTHPILIHAIRAPGIVVPSPVLKEPTQSVKDRASTKSIAILPFVNMSNDQEQEYFCDGITEEIINSLSHLRSLKVIARTSAFMFKNKNEDIRKIGKQLNVETLLEGSVRKSGNRVRITSQLINAQDGSHFWSERYDREMKDIFEIQDEISLAIVDALKIELLGNEREKVVDNKTRNIDAYNLYLRGQFEWYKRTKKGMVESISLFEEALQIDPNYVLAQVGIASAYIAMCDWGVMNPRDALPRAREILQRAEQKNDQHSEIYAVFCYYDLCSWDLNAYRVHHQKCFDLDPQLPFLHHIDAVAGNVLGDYDRALHSNDLARKMDPLSLIFNFARGHTLFLSGRYEEAIEQFKYVISLDQKFEPAHLWTMYSMVQLQNYEGAVSSFKMILLSEPVSAMYVSKVDAIYAATGMEGLLRWVINFGLKFYGRPFNQPYHAAICYALLNEPDQVFKELESLYEIGSFRLSVFRANQFFTKYQDDPRYQALVRKLNIWTTDD